MFPYNSSFVRRKKKRCTSTFQRVAKLYSQPRVIIEFDWNLYIVSLIGCQSSESPQDEVRKKLTITAWYPTQHIMVPLAANCPNIGLLNVVFKSLVWLKDPKKRINFIRTYNIFRTNYKFLTKKLMLQQSRRVFTTL